MAKNVDVMTGLYCPICYGPFQDPRILECGHSSCFNCLKQYAKSKQGIIKCPRCRRTMDEGVAENITKNFDLASYSETFTGKSEGKPKCEQHGESLSGFCRTCERLICGSCCNEHSNHKIGNIDEQFAKMKPQLEQTLKEVEEEKKKIALAIENQETYLDRFKKNEEKITATLQMIFKDIQEGLKDRQREIQRSIETKLIDYKQRQRVARLKKELQNSQEELKLYSTSCEKLLEKPKEYVLKECKEAIDRATERIKAVPSIPKEDVTNEAVPLGSIHYKWAKEAVELIKIYWDDSTLEKWEEEFEIKEKASLMELIEKAKDHERLKVANEALESELGVLRQEVEETNEKFDGIKTKKETLESLLEGSQRELEEMKENCKGKDSEIASLKDDMKKEKENSASAVKRITELKAQVKRLDEAYHKLVEETDGYIHRLCGLKQETSDVFSMQKGVILDIADSSLNEDTSDVIPRSKRPLLEDADDSPKRKATRMSTDEDKADLGLQENQLDQQPETLGPELQNTS